MKKQKIVQEKTIGTMKTRFITNFDEKDEDTISLKMQVSKDLKNLLRKACVGTDKAEDLVSCKHHLGDNDISNLYYNFQRPKVRRAVISSLYSSDTSLLFCTDLLEKGKMEMKFLSLTKLENTISNLQSNIKRFIEVMLKYDDMDFTVSYPIKQVRG